MNIPKLLSELKEDHLVFKISGFADTLAKRQAQDSTASMAENIAAKHGGNNDKGGAGVGAIKVCYVQLVIFIAFSLRLCHCWVLFRPTDYAFQVFA